MSRLLRGAMTKARGWRARVAGGAVAGADAAEVAAYYDAHTADYLAATGEFLQAFRGEDTEALMAYLASAAGIAPGMRVLDAGCGVGGPAIWLARHVPDVQVDALTISPVQAAMARQRVAEAGLERQITVHEGDFHALDRIFAPESHDRVLFFESLGHSADAARVMRAAAGVLRSGGQVYIKDFFARHSADPAVAARMAHAIATINKHYHYHVMRLGDLIEAQVAAGLAPCLLRQPAIVPDLGITMAFEHRIGRLTYPAFASVHAVDWYEVAACKP